MPLVQTRSLAGSRNLMRAALSCKMCKGSCFLELSLSPGGIFCWPLQRVRDVCIIPRLNCHLFDTTKNTILCMKSRGGLSLCARPAGSRPDLDRLLVPGTGGWSFRGYTGRLSSGGFLFPCAGKFATAA